MKSTFNICFYAKKDKQKANGAYPLFARITIRFRNYFDSSFRSLISLLTRALLSISLCHIAYYIILKK